MGEPAIPFWQEEAEDAPEDVPESPFEDVGFAATGETDETWLYGSD